MRTIAILAISMFFAGAHSLFGDDCPHPLTATVGENGEQFHFTHASECGRNGPYVDITNVVKNLHNANQLRVKWPAAGVDRSLRPLGPGDSHTNSYTVEKAKANLEAPFYFGLANNRRIAAVYEDGETQAHHTGVVTRIIPVLKSTILLESSKKEDTFTFEMISTHVGGQIVYSIIQNKRFAIAADFPEQMSFALKESGWTPRPEPFDAIGRDSVVNNKEFWKGQKMPNFKRFVAYQPRMTRTAVAIKSRSTPQILRRFVMLLDPDQRLLGSGFVSFHVPAD